MFINFFQIILVENRVESLFNSMASEMLSEESPSMPPVGTLLTAAMETNEKAIASNEVCALKSY